MGRGAALWNLIEEMGPEKTAVEILFPHDNSTKGGSRRPEEKVEMIDDGCQAEWAGAVNRDLTGFKEIQNHQQQSLWSKMLKKQSEIVKNDNT